MRYRWLNESEILLFETDYECGSDGLYVDNLIDFATKRFVEKEHEILELLSSPPLIKRRGEEQYTRLVCRFQNLSDATIFKLGHSTS